MDKQQLLAQIADVLRTMPSREQFGRCEDETLPWIGRATAAIKRWSMPEGVYADAAARELRHDRIDMVNTGFSRFKALLHQAECDLRMELGQLSSVVPQGQVFEYFDELRKILETARAELFFVDPYLDAEFVSRYLPTVASGVTVRLMAGKRMGTLLPAVELFAQQSKMPIQVRSSASLHDRFVFVDESACYLSGASFKDGARNAPATLTQIIDAFQAMWDTYQALWTAAKVER